MIFITLGSQKFQFNRLLKAMDDLIEHSVITEDVFAQTGYSDYKPLHYRYQQFLDREQFADWESKADLVITHGGTGAIIGAVKKHKKVIAVARLKAYGEHVDDHQLQIIQQFDELGFVIPCRTTEDLTDCLQTAEHFEVKPYVSNTKTIISDLETYLQKYVNK